MKLFLILLLYCTFTYGLPIYKKDLRNMHKIEKNKILLKMIGEDFIHISEQIYREAKTGKSECQFELRCEYHLLINGQCILSRDNSNIQFIMPYKSYTQILLQKINQTFPDSNIIQINKPCCSYIISW